MPVILDPMMSKKFRTYLHNDPELVLQTACVWLGAQSRPINDSDPWTWLSGTTLRMRRLPPSTLSLSVVFCPMHVNSQLTTPSARLNFAALESDMI